MASFAEENYLWTCIDSFSHYIWVGGIKDKHGKPASTAFREILEYIDHPMLSIYSDLGVEFKAHMFKDLMTEYNLHIIFYHWFYKSNRKSS